MYQRRPKDVDETYTTHKGLVAVGAAPGQLDQWCVG